MGLLNIVDVLYWLVKNGSQLHGNTDNLTLPLSDLIFSYPDLMSSYPDLTLTHLTRTYLPFPILPLS